MSMMSLGFHRHHLEIRSYQVTGFAFKLSQNGRAEITFRFAAHDLNINTSAGTNNNTTMATVTFPANREFAQFKHMVVRANAQGGGALAGSDVVYVNDFTLDVERADKVDDVTTQFGNKIDEPLHDNWTVTKVTLGLSKYQDGTGGTNTLLANSLLKSGQKMDVVITGETLAGAVSEKFSLKWFLNDVQFNGFPNVGGPGLTPWTLEGMAHRVLTAPTGFTAGHTDSVICEVVSQLAADPLA